jgi:hypothetical protein
MATASTGVLCWGALPGVTQGGDVHLCSLPGDSRVKVFESISEGSSLCGSCREITTSGEPLMRTSASPFILPQRQIGSEPAEDLGLGLMRRRRAA